MMHKKAGFLFIIVIIFLTLICISCVKDDLLENYEGLPKTTAGMVIKKIRFQDVRSNRQAFQSLQNFRKTNNLTQRGMYYEEFGVFIDTATIVSIEKDNKHSLTFRIINDEKTNTVENLVLQANDNDSYTAYITTYDVTEQEQQQLLNGETLLPKKPSAITKTTTNSRISIGGDGAECAEIHSIQREECPDGKGGYIPFTGENNNNCAGMPVTVTYLVVTINLECMSGGGGSNPGTGPGTPYPGSNPGGTNPGGNGTSPGTQPGNPGTPPDPTEPIRDPGDGTPIITTPVLNVDPKRTHLLELHKITNENYNVRLEIDDFKDNLDYLMEQGVEFNTNSAPFPAQNNVYNGVKFFPVSQNNPVIRLHKHHNELHQVFSAEDILGMTAFFLEKKQIDENNAGTISFIMVSKMGLHAFRVSDMAEAEHFSGIYPTNNAKEIFIDAYVKEVIIESIKECNCTSGAVFDQLLFDNFITFFKGFVWGFDYFYAPHPVNPTDNYTWTKKS